MTVRTTVGPRGRVTIPVALQRQAGVKEGDTVIVRVDGHGRVIIETDAAIKARIRSGVPEPDTEHDAVADIRALRDGVAS